MVRGTSLLYYFLILCIFLKIVSQCVRDICIFVVPSFSFCAASLGTLFVDKSRAQMKLHSIQLANSSGERAVLCESALWLSQNFPTRINLLLILKLDKRIFKMKV